MISPYFELRPGITSIQGRYEASCLDAVPAVEPSSPPEPFLFYFGEHIFDLLRVTHLVPAF
jgi:hypothetical protein